MFHMQLPTMLYIDLYKMLFDINHICFKSAYTKGKKNIRTIKAICHYTEEGTG